MAISQSKHSLLENADKILMGTVFRIVVALVSPQIVCGRLCISYLTVQQFKMLHLRLGFGWVMLYLSCSTYDALLLCFSGNVLI